MVSNAIIISPVYNILITSKSEISLTMNSLLTDVDLFCILISRIRIFSKGFFRSHDRKNLMHGCVE